MDKMLIMHVLSYNMQVESRIVETLIAIVFKFSSRQ